MSELQFNQSWDMDAIFTGGSDSVEFAAFLEALEHQLNVLGETLHTHQGQTLAPAELEEIVTLIQNLSAQLRESEAFTGCLSSQDVKDKKAMALGSTIRTYVAAFETHLTRADQLLTSIPDDKWSEWMQLPAFEPISFPLSERRLAAKEKLAPELESLISDLAVDGYHGWSELYDTTVGLVEVPYEEDNGETSHLSAGRAFNKLHHASKEVRDKTFAAWESTWENHADYCGSALNHLAGFRLATYKHRGWNSILKEPLDMNRMSAETLASMWSAIEQNRSFLLQYFEKKAELLGLEKLGWTDVDAPVGSATLKLSYEEGAALILEQFRKFGPKLAQFTEMALRDRWIEVEDREGKRPGGFCTSFPIKKQTRIFMTYEGTMNNVSTLAHELGHAFHQHVMDDMPELTQHYAMNVAETASTFAEMIVSDAAIQNATDRETKLALLDDKIQRTVAFLMNIHARFLFETSFYEERKKGTVSTERLGELMTESQRKAFHDALASYHPHFWASKLHFYITEVPFYNFPYTFGYLFSAGIYQIAVTEGTGFEDRYIALLRDTGRMTVEELAMKHLNVDLTKPEFWKQAVELTKRDVEQFLAL